VEHYILLLNIWIPKVIKEIWSFTFTPFLRHEISAFESAVRIFTYLHLVWNGMWSYRIMKKIALYFESNSRQVFFVILLPCQQTDSIAWDDRMVGEWWTGEGLELSGHCLINVHSLHFPEGTEEDYEEPSCQILLGLSTKGIWDKRDKQHAWKRREYVVMCRVVCMTKITGSSSEDWIY
jgi:hypothetical protein